jgi:holliday junction DNA helicase RuvA
VIGFLRGKVLHSSPEVVLLDVRDVGYRVQVTVPTYSAVERAVGAGGEDALVELYVHTHAREDDLSLFGFWTEDELELFERLIAVSGIGPKLARVVLSGMAPDDLRRALSAGDVARLSTIPGVGKKTAQRMILELKDKIMAPADAPALSTPGDEDLVAALTNLGYKRNVAQKAVAQSRDAAPDATSEELLRNALKRLSRV